MLPALNSVLFVFSISSALFRSAAGRKQNGENDYSCEKSCYFLHMN
jgi:hypothetical protein